MTCHLTGYELWVQQVRQVFPTGFPITDGLGNTFRFSFSLDVRDDESDKGIHMSAINEMLQSNVVDFVMNVQPAFAIEESIAVNAKTINLHGATGNDEVFARGTSKATAGLSIQNPKNCTSFIPVDAYAI